VSVKTNEADIHVTEQPLQQRIDMVASLALLASVLCWGTVPVLLRDLKDSIGPWSANGLRYSMAAVIYWPVIIVMIAKGHASWRFIGLCAVPAIIACGGQVLWGLAPYYLEATAIGFFVRFSLVWATLGAMILFADERRLLRLPRFYLGLLLSVGGFVVLALLEGLAGANVDQTGVVIMLFCSVCFGLYAVSIRYFIRQFHPVFSFAIVAQFVSLGTLAGMFCFGEPQRIFELSATAWKELVVSSMLGIALGHILLYTGIRRIGTTIASGVQSITPFVTAALGALFLSETMTGLEWTAGITVVIGGLILLTAQSALPTGKASH
jgi:drug/metabolite transporter (DMT)-like permease